MGSPRILVVEDDVVSGMYMKSVLEGYGYDVPFVASSLEEVMKSIPETNPDLVLMDIVLSGPGDGIDAAGSIAVSYDVPIIFLTAYNDEEMIGRARMTGPYGFLLKPVNVSELHIAVEFALYRHQMESRLKRSEELYRGIVENMPVMICRYLPDTNTITYANEEFCHFFDIDRERIIGTSILGLAHGAVRESMVPGFAAFAGENRLVTYEHSLQTTRGERWLRCTEQAICDIQGSVIECQSICQDITERRRIEIALGESEEKFRHLFEKSADAQLLLEDKRIIDCNSAALHLFRAGSKERLLGKKMEELSPPAQPDGTDSFERTAEIYDFVYELESLSFEWVHRSLDGREVPVDVSVTAIPIAGRPVLHAVLKDITVRKLAQSALRRSEQQYRVLVETMSDGMVRVGDGGEVTFANDRFCEMVGRTKREILGNPVMDYVDEDDRENFRNTAFFRKRARKIQYEIALRTGAGKKVFTIVSLRPLAGDSGGFSGFVAVFTDITDRKYLEREVLEISMKEQQRIGRDLHDDLGQILTGTGFLCESLAKKLANKSLPEAEEARAVSALINEAKDHTRLLSRGLSPVEVDSGGIIVALARLVRGIEGMFPVSCTLEYDADLYINDSIVETQFHYIVQESVNNAIKHGRAEHISITLRNKKGQIHLDIRDDGTGIPPESERARGLGLRIMQYRANAIGASIRIGGNSDGGATVSCVWRR